MPATPSFDRLDYRAEVQAALSSLTYARQVLLHSAALLDQSQPLDAPSPDEGLRVEQASAGQLAPPQREAISDDKAERLGQLAALPPIARFTSEEAAVYMNCRTELLRAWRWQKRGPAFEGKGRFVRYLKRDLDAFMSA
jgi:hypothetical protein